MAYRSDVSGSARTNTTRRGILVNDLSAVYSFGKEGIH